MTHCCARMTEAVTHTCAEHPDPFNCPDALIHYNERFSEYGLIVHDGGSSYILIGFCPWCGAQLPESTRERFVAEREQPAVPAAAVEEPAAEPLIPPAETPQKFAPVPEPPPPPSPAPPAPTPPASAEQPAERAQAAARSWPPRAEPPPRRAADPAFDEAVAGLRRGDFSHLEALFQPPTEGAIAPEIVRWHSEGWFTDAPDALAEALTCASFLGYVDVVRYFLKQGVDPSGGSATGMNALHWAANRGQLDVVQLLLKSRAPWEAKSSYGGNVLDTAVWSAIHEPRPVHQEIVVVLLKAGAIPEDQTFPTGHAGIDGLFRQFGRT